MSLLTRLEPDLLRNVVDQLDGSSLVNLWLIGSRLLHYALAERGGARKATLAVSAPLTPSRLPQSIGYLKSLTSLEIHTPDIRIGHPARIWRCLSKLNQLRALSLSFWEAEEWMFEMGDALGSFFEDSDEVMSSGFSNMEFRPIASTFPQLESLTLRTQNFFLQNHDLPKLPPSLTHLDVSGNSRIDQNCLSYLASLPKIASLNIAAIGPVSEKIQLPSTITALSIDRNGPFEIPKSFWNDCKMVDIRMRMLPDSILHVPNESLKTCHLLIYCPPTYSLSLEPTHHPDLFSRFHCLSELRLNPTLTFEYATFPSSLRSLTILLPPITQEVRLNLPPLLTSLSIHCRRYFNAAHCFTALANELKQLTTLQVKGDTKAVLFPSTDCFALLPDSLTSLTWTLPLSKIVDKFPPNLVQLSAPQLNFNLLDTALGLLPASLTDISCGLHFTDAQGPLGPLPTNLQSIRFDIPDEAALTSPYFDALLACCSLTSLALHSSKTDWTLEDIKRLPPTLRTLELHANSFDPKGFGILPKGLTKLHITTTRTPISLRGRLHLLPRSLTSLYLFGEFDLVDDDLTHLPRCINHLSLYGDNAFTENALKTMPSSCVFRCSGALSIAYERIKSRIDSQFEDPDPRVTGGDINRS